MLYAERSARAAATSDELGRARFYIRRSRIEFLRNSDSLRAGGEVWSQRHCESVNSAAKNSRKDYCITARTTVQHGTKTGGKQEPSASIARKARTRKSGCATASWQHSPAALCEVVVGRALAS